MKLSFAPGRASLAAVLGTVLLSGCGTLVQQSYRGSPSGPGVTFLPYSRETEVYGSLNMADDAANLVKDGYVQIGTSSFKTDGHVTFDELQHQARVVGADVVLFSKKIPGTGQAVNPVALNNDGSTHSLAPFVHIGSSETLFGGNYGGKANVGGGSMDFNGTVTSSGIPGVSSADMAAINAPEFMYTATFWKKAKAAF